MKRTAALRSNQGTVLVMVLWIAFGLLVLAIYFAHSMSLELKGAQNRYAILQAEHATAGAARYVTYILTNHGTNGILPNLTQDLPEFRTTGVPVGESYYWLIGRSDLQSDPERAAFGLIDEASKLNLNTATVEMLEALPWMTPELAAAIIDWRDEDSEPTENGAEDEVYARLNPPRRAKNAPFESVEELRLVNGATLELLYGEDANLNGVLDLNENDGDDSAPADNRDGRLDFGLFEYVTVYSRQPNTAPDGSQRTNITTQQGRQQLAEMLAEILGEDRAGEIADAANGNVSSVLQFYVASEMTADEFAQVHTYLTATNGVAEGLINVNTASAAVLACIPGIGTAYAPSLVAFREANPSRLDSLAWVAEVLDDEEAIAECGPYLTDQCYNVTADVAAVGAYGRGFHRSRFVFDQTGDTPTIVFRRDLTSLGWALGTDVREQIQLARENLR